MKKTFFYLNNGALKKFQTPLKKERNDRLFERSFFNLTLTLTYEESFITLYTDLNLKSFNPDKKNTSF